MQFPLIKTIPASLAALFCVSALTGCGGKADSSTSQNLALKAYECRKAYGARIINTDLSKSKSFYVPETRKREIENQMVRNGCPDGFLDRKRD